MKYNLLTKAALALICLTPMVLASCSSDDDLDQPDSPDRGQATRVTNPQGFTFIAPEGLAPLGFSSSSTSYAVDFYPDRTADIFITGISLAQGSQPVKVELTGLKYKTDAAGNYIIDAENVTAKAPGNLVFSDVELIYNDSPAAASDGGVLFAFTAETQDDMNITFIPSTIEATGNTVITSSGAQPYKTSEMSYEIVIKNDNKADIHLHNPKFAAQMPSVGDMLFPDVDITFDDQGGYSLTSASLTPSIAGVPFPSFAISNLRAEVSLDDLNDIDITFLCSPFGTSYTVVADDLSYFCK